MNSKLIGPLRRMTAGRPYELTVEREVDARPGFVYQAFTERLDAWFAAPGSVRMRPAVNEPFYFETRHAERREPHYGRFLRLEPFSVIEMTWVTGPAGTGGAETVVTVELAPSGGGTHLRLIHAGFVDVRARARHVQTWPFVLDALQTALPSGAVLHIRSKEEQWGGLAR
jgi:uncharacterized protein YndB with AHSA1/START domain